MEKDSCEKWFGEIGSGDRWGTDMFGMDGSLNRPYSLSFFCKTFFLKPNSPLYDGRIIDASLRLFYWCFDEKGHDE